MTMKTVIDTVSEGLIERDYECRLIMLAIVSDEHFLMVGPPGTGKSLMADRYIGALAARGFGQLMHKHLPPEELIGPVMLSKLKQDQYERMVTGMLPEAEFAFLDEIWKGSPALLNVQLGILNERKFRNGTSGVVNCPLITAIAASNEWPIGDGYETMGALFDRFLIRKSITAVSTGLRAQLAFGDEPPAVSPVATVADVKQWQAESRAKQWQDDAKDAFLDGIVSLEQQGVIVGDRRIRAATKVAQSSAVLNEHDKVEVSDLDPLKHVLWATPDQEAKAAEVIGKMADPLSYRVQEILMEAKETIDNVKDFNSGEAFSAVSKVKTLMKEMDKIPDPGTGTMDSAKKYIRQLLQDLNRRIIDVT